LILPLNRIKIGAGNSCCLDQPFSSLNNIQYCCNNQITPYYLPLENENTYVKSKCPIESSLVNPKPCKDFQQITHQNETNFIDSNLTPFNSYDYMYCAKNIKGTTCLLNITKATTTASLPCHFDYFTHQVIGNKSVILKWKPPIYLNGPLKYYKLFRNNLEIYQGIELTYLDAYNLNPLSVYKYELEVCNQIGCVRNSKNPTLSIRSKTPESFELTDFIISYSTIQLYWTLPKRTNGLLEKFIILLKETNLEISIRFVYDTTNTTASISLKEPPSIIYFSTDSLLNPNSIFSLKLLDLIPNTKYSVKLLGCTSAGCVEAISRGDELNGYIRLVTDDYHLIGFRDPTIYVKDESTVDIVWQNPNQINGVLSSYKLYRNNVFLVEFSLHLVDNYQLGN
jgi:hypothetical protein